MKITPTADTKALGALALALTTVASGDTAREIVREIATDFDQRVQRQFQVGRGPYGTAWPRPKKGNPPGRDTETLYGKVKARPAGTRILLSAAGVTYASYFSRHVGGIFPDARLPVAWKNAAELITRRIVARKLGKAAR